EAASQLGPIGLVVLLIPSTIMYVVEAYGWKITLGPSAKNIPFWRVLAIRTAGETVNMTTPTAYVGGEPLKAYLLTKHHVPIVEGLASVVIAKTTMTIAEVGFILMGIALAFWSVGADGSSGQTVAGALVSVGFLVLVTAALVFVQQQGLFTWLLEFYRDNRLTFCFSIGLFFVGWMAEALEVYVIIYFLGGPAMALSAISISALSVFIKSGTFF